MDFPYLGCVEGIRIRRSKGIMKFRRISTRPSLCGEHPS
jgi:hypothetical protein